MPEAAADPFSPLHEETLRTIATSGVVRQFPKQTVLIHEGDVGDSLYIILSGRVKIYASNEAGREVVINFCGPGEYVGEMSLYGAAALGVGDHARADVLRHRQPRAVSRLHRRQSGFRAAPDPDAHPPRARATENVKSLALSDVYGRLVRLLNTLAVERDGKHHRAREAHATGYRRSGRRVARHDRQIDEGPRCRRLPARRGPPDHDRQEAAARLVAATPLSQVPHACGLIGQFDRRCPAIARGDSARSASAAEAAGFARSPDALGRPGGARRCDRENSAAPRPIAPCRRALPSVECSPTGSVKTRRRLPDRCKENTMGNDSPMRNEGSTLGHRRQDGGADRHSRRDRRGCRSCVLHRPVPVGARM